MLSQTCLNKFFPAGLLRTFNILISFCLSKNAQNVKHFQTLFGCKLPMKTMGLGLRNIKAMVYSNKKINDNNKIKSYIFQHS